MAKLELLIRDETSDDHPAISEVTCVAFEKMEISNHTEHYIVDALRSANALTVSLVAEVNGRVVGHPQYYRQFGFENIDELSHEGVPPEVFSVLSFDGTFPQGFVFFHEGFKATC